MLNIRQRNCSHQLQDTSLLNVLLYNKNQMFFNHLIGHHAQRISLKSILFDGDDLNYFLSIKPPKSLGSRFINDLNFDNFAIQLLRTELGGKGLGWRSVGRYHPYENKAYHL